LRDLDKRDLIKGDFLLVSGDVVCNYAIEPALTRHRTRRQKDKNAIMTMVLREVGAQHRSKSRGRRPVFVIDPRAERCLHYEEMTRRPKGERYVNIDPELLSSHQELEIREDLVDCYVDICTPDVLSLWSDNFDYQSVRKSFLFGVLKDYELNGKTIHTYILREHYAARVKSLRAYNNVSKDIINRWTYPLCPDSNLVRDQSYRLQRGKTYFEEGVILARGSVVKRRSVIGRGTSIGEGSTVGDSILGRHCLIGKNVTIEGSYLWDNTVIGDGTTIKQAIVANEVVIGRNCTIEPGALLSYQVHVANGVTVPGQSRLTVAATTVKSAATRTRTDVHLVGKGGEGYAYESDSDADSTTSAASSRLVYLNSSAKSSTSSLSSISTLHSDAEDSQLADHLNQRRGSAASTFSDDSVPKATRDFLDDATASVYDGISKSQTPDVIHLELVSQRLSIDATDHLMRLVLIGAFMKRIFHLIEVDGLNANEAAKSVVGRYKELVVTLALFKKEESEKAGMADQVDLLATVLEECEGRDRGESVLLFTVTAFYEEDVVDAEGVLKWWDGGAGGKKGVDKVKGLVDYLRTEASESEEEEDDEDEDEDED
jgi:translation initiation factor eIF-2B subunit epsilon